MGDHGREKWRLISPFPHRFSRALALRKIYKTISYPL